MFRDVIPPQLVNCGDATLRETNRFSHIHVAVVSTMPHPSRHSANSRLPIGESRLVLPLINKNLRQLCRDTTEVCFRNWKFLLQYIYVEMARSKVSPIEGLDNSNAIHKPKLLKHSILVVLTAKLKHFERFFGPLAKLWQFYPGSGTLQTVHFGRFDSKIRALWKAMTIILFLLFFIFILQSINSLIRQEIKYAHGI